MRSICEFLDICHIKQIKKMKDAQIRIKGTPPRLRETVLSLAISFSLRWPLSKPSQSVVLPRYGF